MRVQLVQFKGPSGTAIALVDPDDVDPIADYAPQGMTLDVVFDIEVPDPDYKLLVGETYKRSP